MNELSLDTHDAPLAFPPAAAAASHIPFPFVASIAPVIASGAIWAITGSMFALIFAGLSPLIAIAGVVDGRRHARSARKRAGQERHAALDRLEDSIAARKGQLREKRRDLRPSAATIVSGASGVSEWGERDGRLCVGVGIGEIDSGIRIAGEPIDERECELRRSAGRLDGSPVEMDATAGIGVVGSPLLTRGVARGYLLQLAHARSPELLRIAALPGVGWEWANALPHLGAEGARTVVEIRVASSSAAPDRAGHQASAHGPLAVTGVTRAVIALAESVEELPAACAVVVRVQSPGHAEVEGRSLSGGSCRVEPELILETAAAEVADRLAHRASIAGLVAVTGTIPDRVTFAQIAPTSSGIVEPGTTATANSLAAVVGAGSSGPIILDLVNDGPHAVVGGTTGSGKSELLIAWVAAICATYPPSQVTVLLVDFKGGSAFAALSVLPHCVGIITDLAPGPAERALRSLAAEMRHRERTLADLGARSISEAGGRLARLVIVVDEFATMLDSLPDLHALFVDIAARGRSLGVHIILCTQRPAGVVRDSLLANCALRISLRVHDAVDSVAVVGSDAAARISAATPGRCVIARDDRRHSCQIAALDDDDINKIARASGGEANRPRRRPWLDPLPARIPLDSLKLPVGEDFVLGVRDQPDEQRQSVAAIGTDDPHLLVIGAHGSGKSVLVASVVKQLNAEAVFLPRNIEEVWDALCSASDASAAQQTFMTGDRRRVSRTLILDDLDAHLARMPEDYQSAAVERLTRIARDGPAAGIRLVATVQRITPMLRSWAVLVGDPLLLRQTNRQEYVLAGGLAQLFDDRLAAGGGVWRGHRIQLAICGVPTQYSPGIVEPPSIWLEGRPTILVTRLSRARRAQLSGIVDIEVVDVESMALTRIGSDAGAPDGPTLGTPRTTVFVAEPEVWQSHWPVFVSLRSTCRVLFDACTLADLRALLHTRELPPLCSGADRVWELTGSGRLRRGCLVHTALRARCQTKAAA